MTLPVPGVRSPRCGPGVRALLLLMLTVAPLAAQELVTVTWLSERLRDTNLVLLHVGRKADYEGSHVPGARFLTLNDISVETGLDTVSLSLQMPTPDTLRAALERLGISDHSRIVVIYSDPFLTAATRVLFTLDHAGLSARSALVDGGMAAWQRASLPTTRDVPAPRTGRLSPLTVRQNVVSAAYVRDSVAGRTALVDARASVFYDGVQEAGPRGARKRGHIPGARSVPFNAMESRSGELVTPSVMAATFRAAGVERGDTVIAYCHIGQQATLVWFAARSLGFEAKVFDGSFEEWAYRGWPVALPPSVGRE